MPYILVTGSNGFVASNLVDRLLKENYKVIGISRNDKEVQKHENFIHIQMDLTDCLKLEDIFEEYDISSVIHLAAIAHLKGRKDIDWNEFYRINTLASKNIFKLARKFNSYVFFSSTVDVYGGHNAPEITEDSDITPKSKYAQSKFLAERVLENEFQGLPKYLIARFAPVYGKGFMKDVYKRAYINYPKIGYKIGRGKEYHFVSVLNVVNFIMEWLKSEEKPAGIYNVCDGELVNSYDLLKYEINKGNRPLFIIPIPKFLIPTINLFVELGSKLIKSTLLQRLQMNIYKVIKPPKYSNTKMRAIYDPQWNLKQTVYDTENKK